MAQQSTVTVTGYVGADPKMLGGDDGKVPCCVFRVASTRRYFSRKDGRWEDLPTTWMQVRTYRNLARNIKDSISRGDPVIVNGQLISDSWKDSHGNTRTALSIEAQSVGHDLSRGVARFRRMPSSERAEEDVERRADSSHSSQSAQFPDFDGMRDADCAGSLEPQGDSAEPGDHPLPGE